MSQQRRRQSHRMQLRRGLFGNGLLLALLICFGLGPATAWAVNIKVGPSPAVCGGPCDHSTIQAAIDAASAGDTITVYRLTGASECYDEHIIVNVANLTIQGASKTASDAACLGPTTGGDMVTVSASGVTLKDLEISGKAGASSSFGNGGRASGSGVLITASGTTTIENCTISYTASDNVRYAGGAGGNVVIQNSYLHHSDSKGNVYIYRGGSSSDPHKISDCLIHTGRGLLIEADYVTVEKSIIKGWPYYGALGSGGLANYPEQGPGDSRRGWRYYSNCRVGIWVNSFPSDANHNVLIKNNVVIGARQGIRVGTVGTIQNNTVVNPYSLHSYDPTINAGDSAAVTARLEAIRDNTFGIMISNSFAGSLLNNIVIVEADNRYAGYAGYTTADSAPYYTPGILGYGIGFNSIAVNPTLNGATIKRNSVWGFVDPDQRDSNWGPNLTDCGRNCTSGCSENISSDPNFASDTSDESNGGSSPCDADADDNRCYELYDDNYFLSSKKGSCHGNIRPNTAGYFGFVDLTDNDVDSDDFKGLADCSDANWPTTADTDSKYSFVELGDGGTVLNMGAFGGTDRAGKVPPVGIKAITLGNGSVKDGTEGYSGPGVIQARSSGITNVYVDFTQDVSISSTDVDIRNVCDTADLADPDTFSYDNGGGLGPFRLTMTWNTGFVNQGILIRINDTVTDLSANALDGEFADPVTSTIPGGNDTAGGDAVFTVFSVVGDVTGDRQITSADLTSITALDGSTTSGLPEDLDGDGTVEGTNGEEDYEVAEAVVADHWITTTTDSGAGSLRQALTDVADSEKIKFDFGTFKTCSPATIDVDSSALPALDNSSVTIDASIAGVILADSDGDLGDNDDGLTISGSSNIIRGLQIQDFTGKNAAGIYITGSSNTIGGVLNTSADNGLGQGCRISANKEGIHITTGGSNSIQGCLIGTDLAGTADDGNTDEGIWIAGSGSNTIGGDRDDGYGNVISGNNKQGILMKDAGSTGNVIKGNYIGVGADGTTALGNSQEGIKIDKAPSNTIGSTTAGEENVIANNIKEGVEIKDGASDFNTLRANLIYDNGALAIDITSAGANEDVAAVSVDTVSTTQVDGSGADAGATVDVFTNTDGDSDCKVYVGSATADGSGDWTLSSLSLTANDYAVAVQTDSSSNSSEVSAAVQIVVKNVTVDTTSDVSDGTTTDIVSLIASPGADGKISLREALTAIADNQTIWFDTGVFPPATPATIDVDSSALPALDNNTVTINASNAGVIIEDSDGDLAAGQDGLTISGDSNIITGLQIKNFDAGSGSCGIYITGASNTIGGTFNGGASNGLGQGCLISSNYDGIGISGAAATGNTIKGCLIGTNLAGTADDGNTADGIYVSSSAGSSTIGGTTAAERNIISANGAAGISIDGSNSNTVHGNYIGLDINASTTDLGNTTYGVEITNGSQSNTIGGATSGQENTIAYNDSTGVYATGASSDNNTWRANLIYDNSGIAVDLAGDGANDDLAAPNLSCADVNTVIGSGAAANATIDIFTSTANDTDCEVYVTSYTADGSGDFFINVSPDLTQNDYLVVIQTDSSGNSSEASANVQIAASGCEPGWYNNDWGYRKKITIDYTKVSTVDSTDLSSFPVLISRTDVDWKDTVNSGNVGQPDGGDILFTSANGTTKLDHQIESYTDSTGELVAWVEVPTVRATTDTEIFIYYGNAGVADQWNDSGTWDGNYQGVWHLSEATDDSNADATSNSNDGTPSGSPVASTGKMSGALQFNVGTTLQRIDIAAHDSLDLTLDANWTISAWVKPTEYNATNDWPLIYSYGNYRASLGLTNTEGTAGTLEHWANDVDDLHSNNPTTFDAWNHIAVVRDPTTTYFYLNGVADGSAASVAITSGGQTSFIGSESLYGDQADLIGLIDEVRVSDTSRSADWIVTSYNSQNSPATFYSVDAEETP